MIDDYYEAALEDEEENESERLILTMGDDGKATIKKQSDFVEMSKEDAELIKGFIEENKELFKKYCEKEKFLGTDKTGSESKDED